MTATRASTRDKNDGSGTMTRSGRPNRPSGPARSVTEHVTPPGANIFLDLGSARGEAECLRVRTLLMNELRRIIGDVPKRPAAKVVTGLMKGRIDLFTIDALVSMLGRVGAQVNIQVALPPR
jgi:hypothetical protein